MTYQLIIISILVLLLPYNAVWAQTLIQPDPQLWGLCEPDPLAPLITAETGVSEEDAPIDFSADFAESTPETAILTGHVEVEQGDRHLTAPVVSFNRQTNQIKAEDVSYGDPNLAIRSNRAEVDLTEEFGQFTEAQYYLPSRNAQGRAERVETNRQTRKARLEEATYSTCERGQQEMWELRARRIDINEAEGWGSARDVTLAIKDTPVLYLPYLSFPITDDRKTGFLYPRVGYDSDSGADITIPYYWNIAPNRDMTIAPRILSERGVMLGGEYRFLYPKHRGEIDVEYLPYDAVENEGRGAVNIRHQANFRPNLHTDLLFQEVSDDEYLDDFSNNLDLLNPSSLERHLEAIYYGDEWIALGRLQDFQTIDDDIFNIDNRPYSRLPQLLFDGTWPQRTFGLTYEMLGELVYFHRDDEVPIGTRLDLKPRISLPLEWPAGYLIPRLSYRLTAYALQDTGPQFSNNPTRALPILSVDSGLFFERNLHWDQWTGIQTLEPRLFYLYVPFEDQSDIPVFDSVEVDRTFPWLFLENRFTGADRQGDANQLAAALTSRFLDADDGRERLRASIGQVIFFRDREVTLRNTGAEEDSTSEIFTEVVLHPTWNWSFRGTWQWDPQENDTRRTTLDLRYRPSGGKLANLAYRLAENDNDVEQVDVSLVWPINPQWRTMGRWNFDLRESRNLDALAGLEYNECCWALRGLVRYHRDEPQDEADLSVSLELVLKGLAGVGTDIDDLLENAILGFQRTRYD